LATLSKGFVYSSYACINVTETVEAHCDKHELSFFYGVQANRWDKLCLLGAIILRIKEFSFFVKTHSTMLNRITERTSE